MINLKRILKGHEGETFYNPMYGEITLSYIDLNYICFTVPSIDNELFTDYSGCSLETNELIVFPSKTQRDWEKWSKPKTWSELEESCSSHSSNEKECEKAVDFINTYNVSIYSSVEFVNDQNEFFSDVDCYSENSLVEKSALAFLKIHTLIEQSYGGNITNEEWKHTEKIKYVPYYNIDSNMFIASTGYINKHIIAFRTIEQAEEFLGYEENIKLLKDYYMI